MTKSLLKNYRQSPRKVRLVADAVKGKKVDDALTTLRFMSQRASDPIKKVIESALANAKSNSISTENFIVKDITVDEGITLKRWRPKWRGTAHPIRKRTSHIKVVLGTKDGKSEMTEEKVEVKEESADKKVKEAPAKKKVAKKSVKKTTKKAEKKVTKSKK